MHWYLDANPCFIGDWIHHGGEERGYGGYAIVTIVQRGTAIMNNILYFVIVSSPVLSIDWRHRGGPDVEDQVGEKSNEDEFSAFCLSP